MVMVDLMLIMRSTVKVLQDDDDDADEDPEYHCYRLRHLQHRQMIVVDLVVIMRLNEMTMMKMKVLQDDDADDDPS